MRKFFATRILARAMAVFFAMIGMMLPASAMNVSPMTVDLVDTGARSTARIQILNINSQPLPYEVRVFRVEFDADGNFSEKPADSEFIVFPTQGVVKTNQRQMVRLQWIGGKLESSQGYYVSINQLPVALEAPKDDPTKRTVNVQLIYHMKVLVTVSPPGAAPKIVVQDARPTIIPAGKPGENPQPGVAIVVTNTGKRHAMMAGVTWTIEGKGKDGKPLRIVIPSGKMGELLGAGYVPALNGKRTLSVPTGVEFSDAPISVKFSN